ncbi:MAG TPA: TonB family protein [Rhizomicrobium sp.]
MRFIASIFAISVGVAFATNAAAADTPASTISELGTPPADYTPPVADGPHNLAGPYPPEARRLNEEGRVFIVFTVLKDGSVAEASVMRSSGFADLDQAALESVKTWRYRPAIADGKPIEVRWRTYVDFRLASPAQPNITPPRADGSPHTVAAFYPATARRLGEQGIVTLKFTITVEGTVADPSVVGSSGFADLDDAALEAVRTWHYKPATQDGKPIPVASELRVRFELTGHGVDDIVPVTPYVELHMMGTDAVSPASDALPPPNANAMPSDYAPPADDGPNNTADFYPVMARARNEQGRAYVEFTVRKDGSVAEPSLTKSTGFADLDMAAIQAVESWRYKPATANGKTIEARWKAHVDFQLGITPPRTDGPPHDVISFYPVSAKRVHEKGIVQLMYLVTKEGAVADTVVVKSSDFADLDAAALQAAKTWRYIPATIDGKPVAVRERAYIDFGVRDGYEILPGLPYDAEFQVGGFSPSVLASAADEGRVVFSLLAQGNGIFGDAILVQSSGDADLDAKMLESVRKGGFHPTIWDGEPVGSRISIAVKVYASAIPKPAISAPPTP